MQDLKQHIADFMNRTRQQLPGARLAQGAAVISTETDGNDSNITVEIPKEWQPMTANGSQ